MTYLPSEHSWQRIVTFGLVYLGLGIVSAILTNPIQSDTIQAVMRVGILLLSFAVLLTHLHFEICRYHKTVRGASFLTSGAVAFGTFSLAV